MNMSELVVMAADEARRITDQIKTGVEAVWHLVTRAYTERAWDALGYASWDDYCTREFGTSRLRLPREERTEVVASLREQGLSVRAIAAATGIDRRTLQRNRLTGGGIAATSPDDGAESDALAEELITADAVVVGMDGKSYPARKPPQQRPRKNPVLGTASRLNSSLLELAERLERFYASTDYQDAHIIVDQLMDDGLTAIANAIGDRKQPNHTKETTHV